jgi:two-component system sensor histidine kinase CpxA
MTFRARSLYAKIFLWFCLTVAVSTALVLLVAGLTGSQPFGRRYVAVTQDLYARTAVDLFTTGGAPALQRYMAVLEQNSGIECHLLLLDGAGPSTGLLGEPVPAQDRRVLQQSLRTGVSSSHFDRNFWTAASIVDASAATPGQRYLFLLSARPLRGFMDGAFFTLAAPRIGGGLVVVAVFCLLLARHITQPIRVLQSAATRMAAGDLSVRTRPSLPHRSDELAAMSIAFDTMAGRIQDLLKSKEALLDTQRQMLADISHELRSPLTRIGVSLELLRRGETDVLEPMQADLDRLNQMIGQVLALSRLDLEPPPQRPQTLDLTDLLESIVDNAGHEGRGRQTSVLLTAAAPCLVRGEEPLLHSCIENVVRNALQYTPPGGTVRVQLQHTHDAAIVRVEDEGPGVPAESLSRLFTPFFRGPGSGEAHPQGTGLGLSISARIARRHGGTLTASNRSPHGLEVILRLPAHPDLAHLPQVS